MVEELTKQFLSLLIEFLGKVLGFIGNLEIEIPAERLEVLDL